MQKYKKQKNGKYVASVFDGTYTPTGKKHRKYLYSTKSSRDLEKKVKEFEDSVQNRNYVRKGDITFLDYAREWNNLYKSSAALKTREMYDRIIETHVSYERSVLLRDFQAVHLMSIYKHADGKKRTQQQILLTIKQIIDQAVRDKLYTAIDAENLYNAFPKVK